MTLSRITTLAATAAAVAALAGCGGGSSGGGSNGGGGNGGGGDAKEAVTNYIQAIKNQDWSSACDLISNASKKVIETKAHAKCPDALKKGLSGGNGAEVAKLLASAQVGDAKVNGNRGTVGIKLKLNGVERTLPIPVVKEDGQWKVASSNVS